MASDELDLKDALFVLARHGETKLNSQDKFRGWSDDDSAALDKKGVRQAKVSGRFLSKLPVEFGIIVTSDLDRAVHTAAIIGRILGINDIHTDERLRPLDVGDYTGKDKDTNDIDFYLENPDEPFPNGESVNGFSSRQKDFDADLFNWIKDNPGKKPIVVGHLSNVIYQEDLGKALNGYLKFYASDKEDIIHPGGVVAIYPDNKVVAILGKNDKASKSDEGGE